MHKQELVQLHALGVLVRRHLEEHHDVPDDAFQAYDDFGVPPTAIHRRKASHREALDRLLDDLTAATEGLSSLPERQRQPDLT
ncbi:MAG: UPF0058 family protein [Haloplanus sp.]